MDFRWSTWALVYCCLLVLPGWVLHIYPSRISLGTLLLPGFELVDVSLANISWLKFWIWSIFGCFLRCRRPVHWPVELSNVSSGIHSRTRWVYFIISRSMPSGNPAAFQSFFTRSIMRSLPYFGWWSNNRRTGAWAGSTIRMLSRDGLRPGFHISRFICRVFHSSNSNSNNNNNINGKQINSKKIVDIKDVCISDNGNNIIFGLRLYV